MTDKEMRMALNVMRECFFIGASLAAISKENHYFNSDGVESALGIALRRAFDHCVNETEEEAEE